MKINYKFLPQGTQPTHANSIIDYVEIYLNQLCSVLMHASMGSPEHINFLLKTKIHPYSKFRKIALQPKKLKQKLFMVSSITTAYINIDNGKVLIQFVNAHNVNMNVNVSIAQSDLIRAIRMFKIVTL